MKSLFITLLCLLAFFSISWGQAPYQPERIGAWLDYACFQYEPNDSLTLVEFYYGLQRHQLTFAMTDTTYSANADILIEIEDTNGVVLDTLSKHITTSVGSPAEVSNKHVKLTDQMSYAVKPGTYIASLYIEDLESRTGDEPMTGKYGQRKVRVVVPDLSANSLRMSGVELSYKIDFLPQDVQIIDYKSIDKSQRRVVPNPSRIFVNQDSIMYFYSEVYGLLFGSDVSRDFTVTCEVLDSYGAVASSYGQRRQIKPGSVAIVSSALDIHDLPEGNYALRLEVRDKATGKTAETMKPFQVLSAGFELSPGVSESTFTEEDAEYLENVLKYVMTSEQKKTLAELSLQGKMRFFEDFWARSDPDPSTRLNEFKVELFRRFNYANEHYTLGVQSKIDGWQTDRGRIYIMYGEPDEIEYHPSTPDLEPFERWNYYSLGTQGTTFFIFVDETGYGDYTLAHSDAKGEPYDPKWQDRIDSGRLDDNF